MIHTCLSYLCRETTHRHHSATTVLIPLHSFINVMRNDTSCVHPNSYYISKLLFVSSLSPVSLSLTPSQYVGLKLPAELVQSVNLYPVCKDPQAIEIFHHDLYAVIGLGSWSLAVCWLAPKVINLPCDLVVCARLMLSYLVGRSSKEGVIISK
jgi:hypothetical protein